MVNRQDTHKGRSGMDGDFKEVKPWGANFRNVVIDVDQRKKEDEIDDPGEGAVQPKRFKRVAGSYRFTIDGGGARVAQAQAGIAGEDKLLDSKDWGDDSAQAGQQKQ